MTQFWAKLFHLDALAGTEARAQRRGATERWGIKKKKKRKEGYIRIKMPGFSFIAEPQWQLVEVQPSGAVVAELWLLNAGAIFAPAVPQ